MYRHEGIDVLGIAGVKRFHAVIYKALKLKTRLLDHRIRVSNCASSTQELLTAPNGSSSTLGSYALGVYAIAENTINGTVVLEPHNRLAMDDRKHP